MFDKKIHTRAKIPLNVRAMLISKLNDFHYHVGCAYDIGVRDLNAMQKIKGCKLDDCFEEKS